MWSLMNAQTVLLSHNKCQLASLPRLQYLDTELITSATSYGPVEMKITADWIIGPQLKSYVKKLGGSSKL